MRVALMAGVMALAIGMSGCGRPSAPGVASLAAGDPVIAEVYRKHDERLFWLAGHALNDRGRLVIHTLARAEEDGLDPGKYLPAGLEGARVLGDPAAVDVALSRGLVEYAADLRRPTGRSRFIYTDAALPPTTPNASAVLERVAFGEAPARSIATLRRVNPVYDGLRTALAHQRHAPAATAQALRAQRLILINMDRARDLPPDFGERYVWVDIPAARLTAFEAGAPRLTMAVVVGKREMPTPMMVGMLRYAVVNPYWNIPEDLVRDSIAPKALREGRAYLARENLEVLSDWSEQARPLAPTEISWRAVASGAVSPRVRQKPGPGNMMGAMKLMSPNNLGIYLHDTPRRDLFANATRTFSSGCVRLQDAPALARWLFGADPRSPGAGPETRVDLQRPTPLYLTYFTALPKPGGGVELRDDVYGLDRAALGEIAARETRRMAG